MEKIGANLYYLSGLCSVHLIGKPIFVWYHYLKDTFVKCANTHTWFQFSEMIAVTHWSNIGV